MSAVFFYVLKQLYLLYVPTGGVIVNIFANKWLIKSFLYNNLLNVYMLCGSISSISINISSI